MAAAGAAHADDLMAAWRAAQSRDMAYIAARQTVEGAERRESQMRASAGGTGLQGAQRTDYWSTVDQAQAQLRQLRERLRGVEQDLMLRVARAYFDVLAARQAADLALAQLNALALQLRVAQRNAEPQVRQASGTAAAGAPTPAQATADLAEARERFDAARAQRVAATRELELRRAALEKVIGRSPDTLDPLRADAVPWTPETPEPDMWVALAGQDNPRVRMQQAAIDVAAMQVERLRAGDETMVDLTASRKGIFNDGSLNTPSEMAVRSRSKQLGLLLTVPLTSGGSSSSGLRDAQAAQESAENELQAARSQSASQVRQAFAGLRLAASMAESANAAVAASRSALDASAARLKPGARIPADLPAAARRLYEAQRDAFKTRVDQLMQGLQLRAAAGSLREDSLAEVNALLDPKRPLRFADAPPREPAKP